MNIDWRPMPGFEKYYQVSEYGEVWSINRQIILRGGIDKKGYHRVRVGYGDFKYTWKVHRLVAQIFIGTCPEGYQVNHIDGVKLNNHFSNLEYVTHLENMRHAKLLGLRDHIDLSGQKNGASVMTDEQALEVKALIASRKHSLREIGAMYGVGKDIISLINCGKNWRHLGDYTYPIRTGSVRIYQTKMKARIS